MAKILVIDDDSSMRRLTCRILERAGYEVTGYENGRGGLAHLQRDRPDLVITDIFMPEIEGLETIRRARGSGSNVPILAISGFSSEDADYLKIAEKFGASGSLKKPFRAAELLEIVARLLAPRHSG